jgi:hypothetical protein
VLTSGAHGREPAHPGRLQGGQDAPGGGGGHWVILAAARVYTGDHPVASGHQRCRYLVVGQSRRDRDRDLERGMAEGEPAPIPHHRGDLMPGLQGLPHDLTADTADQPNTVNFI